HTIFSRDWSSDVCSSDLFGAVDTLPEGSTVYVNRRGVTGRDAQLDWALGMMNDGNTIFENITNLMGDGSNSDAKTVVVGRGKQRSEERRVGKEWRSRWSR